MTAFGFKIFSSIIRLRIFFPSEKIRDLVLKEFKQKNIGSSIHYATPVPLMSYYKNKYNLKNKDFSNAEKYGKTSISLPVHPFIKNTMIKNIYSVIKENL